MIRCLLCYAIGSSTYLLLSSTKTVLLHSTIKQHYYTELLNTLSKHDVPNFPMIYISSSSYIAIHNVNTSASLYNVPLTRSIR